MAQKLTKSDLEYLKKNYRTRSNRQLAEDLKVDKQAVVHALHSLGLHRTHEEENKLKAKNILQETSPKSQAMVFFPTPKYYHWIVLTTLFILVFVLYANTFKNQFLWDDEILIVNNNYIKSWNHIPDFFTQNTFKGGDRDSNFWRPTQLFSYLIDYKIWGLNPFGFHLSNILSHALVCILVYLFIFLLFKRKELAFLVGLLYTVHPIHTEAVTYMAGRADSIATLFILLSLCLYIRYTQSTEPKDILVYFGSFLSFILALMSKEMAMMLPLYILFIDISTFKNQKRKSRENLILRYIPILFLLGIYLYLRATLLDFSNISFLEEQPARQVPLTIRLITFMRSLMGFGMNPDTHNFDLGYLWLLLFPFNLHMERGTPYAKSIYELAYLVSFFGFLILLVLTVYFYRRFKPRFFGLAFFLAAMIPFSDIIPLNANMSEHWLYIPSIGIFLVVGEVFASLLKLKSHHSLQDIFKKIIFSPIPTYLIYCSVLTVIRNLDWKDEFTIWKETARLSNSSHIHGNLGVAYGRRHDIQAAKKEFLKALQLQFNYPEAHNNLGMIYMIEGNLQTAKREFEWAIKFNPNYSNAYKNLGDILAQTGHLEEAKKLWQKAIEINPYQEEARKKLEGT